MVQLTISSRVLLAARVRGQEGCWAPQGYAKGYVCMHLCVCLRMHVSIYFTVMLCKRVCTHACVRMCLCTYVVRTYAYIYIINVDQECVCLYSPGTQGYTRMYMCMHAKHMHMHERKDTNVCAHAYNTNAKAREKLMCKRSTSKQEHRKHLSWIFRLGFRIQKINSRG
jgi:hypothetical protein